MSEDKKELSPEEYTERKNTLNDFYVSESVYLENQLKYEELLRDISKTRAERLQADSYILQMTTQEESGEDVSE